MGISPRTPCGYAPRVFRAFPRFQDVKMTAPISIRMGGYGPPTTGFSKALKFIGDKLQAEFGDRVAIEYVWNIMDHGYKAEDILTLVENGKMTLGYQSSSYLTDRVPELGFVDLPFLFASNAQARASMDGELGAYLVRKTEERIGYRILGWFENGFRHISNRLRPVHLPADLKGMKIRVLPSEIQRRTFELLGAIAMRMDLTEAIAMIKAGTLGRAGKSARQYRYLRRAQVSQVPYAHLSFLYFAPDFPAPRLVRRLAGRPEARDAEGGDRSGHLPTQTRGGGTRAVAQDHRGCRLRDRRADAAGT